MFGSFVFNRVFFVGLLDLFSLLFRASSEMKINKIENGNKETIRFDSISFNWSVLIGYCN